MFFLSWKYILLIFAFALILTLFKLFQQITKRRSLTYPYEKQPSLLSPAEHLFYTALRSTLADQYQIMAKVRLADLIKVRPQTNISLTQKAFNRISAKHIDFVACDPPTLTPCFLIELDDKTHKLQKRQARDQFVDNALEAAGIPIFHFVARSNYLPAEIRSKIFPQKTIDNNPAPTYNSSPGAPHGQKDPRSTR